MALPLAVAATATGLTYGLLLGHRTDYVGHFLAGFGGTLLLLTPPLLVFRRAMGWSTLLLVSGAIAIGFVMESTVYRIAIFDPVDFCNQSLGAVVAGSGVAGRRGSPAATAGAFVLGCACLVLGFVYAFA